MKINWNEAPEGFPLWLEGTNEDHRQHSGWYRERGLVYEGAAGGQWRGCREGQFFTVHRKPDFSAWTGSGLPPVGTVCEAKMPPRGLEVKGQEWPWRKVEVVKSGMVGIAESECLVFDLENTAPAWVDEFRPIRTPEQIAAEEREAKGKAMYLSVYFAAEQDQWEHLPEATRETFRLAIDAGWQKVAQ